MMARGGKKIESSLVFLVSLIKRVPNGSFWRGESREETNFQVENLYVKIHIRGTVFVTAICVHCVWHVVFGR